jgi:hypothetical protein
MLNNWFIRLSAMGREYVRTALFISAPQKQRARPSCVCVGIFNPASYSAYFHAVKSRS